MRISILPKTSLGRWSVGLAAACFLPPLVQWLAGPELHSAVDPVALIITVALGILGIGSVVTGLISIIKRKERSILVFVAVIVALFFLFIDTMMNLDLAGIYPA